VVVISKIILELFHSCFSWTNLEINISELNILFLGERGVFETFTTGSSLLHPSLPPPLCRKRFQDLPS